MLSGVLGVFKKELYFECYLGGMTEDYKKLLQLIDGIRNRPTDYLGRLSEYDFVNAIDAAGVHYKTRKLPPVPPGVNAAMRPLHELSFVLNSQEMEISFSWAGYLLSFSEASAL